MAGDQLELPFGVQAWPEELPSWRRQLAHEPALARAASSQRGDAAALKLWEELPETLLRQLPERMDAALLVMGWTHPAWGSIRGRIEDRWGAKALAKADKALHRRIEARWG